MSSVRYDLSPAPDSSDSELLKGELLHGSAGWFRIVSPLMPIGTSSDPYKVLRLETTESGNIELGKEVLISLDLEHRSSLISISLRAVIEQIHYHQAQDYQTLVGRLINPEGITSPSERDKLTLGCSLMKNEVDKHLPSICQSLLSALAEGPDLFYDTFADILERLNEGEGATFRERVAPERFFERSIRQLNHEDLTHDGSAPWVREQLSSDLEAVWLCIILESLWRGDLESRAYKTNALQRHVPHMILDLSSSRIPEVTTGIVNRYEYTDNIWLDAQALVGLPEKVAERVLAQPSQGYVIDIVKLLITLWTEHPEIQRTGRFSIKGRYVGLMEELHTRFGVSKSADARQGVVAACHFLNGLRYGPSEMSYANLVAIGGLESRGELNFTYLEGFLSPMNAGERLVPILYHPTGATKSRVYYNRLGLSIGCLLVEESNAYYKSNGAGLHLTNTRYAYLQERSGIKKRETLKKHLNRFAEDGAIEYDNDIIKLGEKNRAGERLILEGELKVLRGRKGGIRSGEARRRRGRQKKS